MLLIAENIQTTLFLSVWKNTVRFEILNRKRHTAFKLHNHSILNAPSNPTFDQTPSCWLSHSTKCHAKLLLEGTSGYRVSISSPGHLPQCLTTPSGKRYPAWGHLLLSVHGYLGEETNPHPVTISPRVVVQGSAAPSSFPLSSLNTPCSLSHTSQDILSTPLISFVTLLWKEKQSLISSISWTKHITW